MVCWLVTREPGGDVTFRVTMVQKRSDEELNRSGDCVLLKGVSTSLVASEPRRGRGGEGGL